MIKIFYVIDSFAMGGAQRQLLELLRGLNRTRYEAAVGTVWPLMDLEEEYRETGVQVYTIHKHCHWDISFSWRLARQMKAFRPHIVHAWLSTGNLWGHVAASLARVPVVLLSLRNIVKPGAEPGYYSWVHSAIHHLAGPVDAIIANSRTQLENPGVPGWKNSGKLQVIYNGVDLRRFNLKHAPAWKDKLRRELGLSSNTLVVGTIGRLAPQKRQDRFLKAVRYLVDSGYDLVAVLTGEGPLRAELEGLAARLQLQDRIFFLGARQDIPELLAWFDIFVLPSDWEGFPNVILEAMAMGRPVVATDVGGVAELVLRGKTGLLLDADEPSLLAEAIKKLIDNPNLAQQMGEAGRRRAEEKFSLGRMVEQTTGLYQDLLPGKGLAFCPSVEPHPRLLKDKV
jgi:glycosyltransferase involved in cell wall biosynthesis